MHSHFLWALPAPRIFEGLFGSSAYLCSYYAHISINVYTGKHVCGYIVYSTAWDSKQKLSLFRHHSKLRDRLIICTLLAFLSYIAKIMAGNQERTFIMVKPDGVQRGLVGEIIKRFETKGFKLVALKCVWVSHWRFFYYKSRSISPVNKFA